MDLPIKSIGELLSDERPENVLGLLLEGQETALRKDVAEKQSQLDKLAELKRTLKTAEHFSLESILDIAHIMENKKNMKKLRTILLATGIPVGIVEWTTILFWIITGNWRPFAAYLVVFIPYAVWISRYYFKRVAYICPECHAVFKPSLKEAFFARHTPTLRRVTCTHCGHKGFCVETYDPALET
jgi:DNA-directed RNA polymerase subunit RPC12/RpoP